MKARNPLPKSTKPIARRTRLPRAKTFLKRSPIKKRVTKRAAATRQAMVTALLTYFTPPSEAKPCQICSRALGLPMADPCHKYRRWKGKHGPDQILAGHRECHRWMDNKAHAEREREAQASPASCAAGGVVIWSPKVKASLEEFLKTRIDRIN